VEVQVEIESAAKALREEHGAGAGGERGLTARGGVALARTRARKSLGGVTFGVAVPAPGVVAVLGLFGLAGARRRR
jgi:hypothetical protein